MMYHHPKRQLEARIKLCRIRKLITQSRMAELLNTTRLSVRSWETGRVLMRWQIIEAIEALPEPEVFFEGDNDRIVFDIENG